MHDLIREHARALGDRDPDSDRQQGLERLLEYYQHAAASADALVARQARRAPAPPAGTLVPVLVGREQALEWARAERAALLACLAHATETGQHARVIALTAGPAACCATTAPGPRPSPFMSLRCKRPSIPATGPARPAPSLTRVSAPVNRPQSVEQGWLRTCRLLPGPTLISGTA